MAATKSATIPISILGEPATFQNPIRYPLIAPLVAGARRADLATLEAAPYNSNTIRFMTHSHPSAGRDALLEATNVRVAADYRLSVVIPVYNERDTLPKLLAELLRQMPDAREAEVIVVDDGSTDGTRAWLTDFVGGDFDQPLGVQVTGDGQLQCLPEAPGRVSMRVVLQPKNGGKGAALRKGFSLTRYEVIVIQDADLEYDPSDLRRMFTLVKKGVADVVYGSRFAGMPSRSLYMHHYLANWLISTLIDVLCNATLHDIEVCYKMFKREVLDGMNLVSNDFGFEVEFTVKMLLARRWRLYEVGICYYGRTYAEGKKINWKDGLKALWYIFRFRFSS